MTKIANQNTQFQRQQKEPQQPQERDRYVFRISWLLVPLCILGMWYLLSHVEPVVEWEKLTTILRVKNKERYAMFFILCLVVTFVVAAVRILGRKDNE